MNRIDITQQTTKFNIEPLTGNIKFGYYLNATPTKGRIAYEYQPLHNLRLTKDTQIGNQLFQAGTLIDFDTTRLKFDLTKPVDIQCQPSYDGSVNLILNDDKNIPRLINTRFSTRQLNTYEIVDRNGNNDTNIYDDDDTQFDLDTSLYKRVNNIPTVNFLGITQSGNLQVGNYVFYFKYCDADDNETDFIAESGIIAIFRGNDRDPFTIDGGIKNMNAHKSAQLELSDIDTSYDYVKVYYTRTTADQDQSRVVEAFKLTKKFVVRHEQCIINITGDEDKVQIPLSEINAQYFLASHAKTATQIQNRLFLGNISKPNIPYSDLTDISIRMFPYMRTDDANTLIGSVSPDTYLDTNDVNTNYEYYNTKNIYYHVGYWNEEIYRIGIVYIMDDGSLSPVFNLRGINGLPRFEELNTTYTQLKEESTQLYSEGKRVYLEVDEQNYTIKNNNNNLQNAKGVIRFNDQKEYNESSPQQRIYSIGVFISEEIINYLKTLNIKGFFFVRQSRIPTILAQAYTLPYDNCSELPAISYNDKVIMESFLSKKCKLTNSYEERIVEFDDIHKSKMKHTRALTAICPEFMVKQPFFNQLFTGSSYPIRETPLQLSQLERDSGNPRMYLTRSFSKNTNNTNFLSSKIVAVTDEIPQVAIDDTIFRGVAGSAEEAYRFRFIQQEKYDNEEQPKDLSFIAKAYGIEKDSKRLTLFKSTESIKPHEYARGLYSPYLGMISSENVDYNKVINIYVPGYSIGQMNNYFKIRYEDSSPYEAVSDRIDINKFSQRWNKINIDDEIGFTSEFFRGDCYLSTFTYRVNRNFSDPTSPTNDVIIDENTWSDNYDSKDTSNFDKINRGDVNAVQLGSWITIKLRTTINLALRSLDTSQIEEKGIYGNPRGWYPIQQGRWLGTNKIPESYVYNDGLASNLGYRYNETLPDAPYYKNNFENRIIFSDIAVNDAYRNGYRVFNLANYKDYTKEYGSIVKIANLNGALIIIFEHGIAKLNVNEKVQVSEAGQVYIQSLGVLPTQPMIISDMYGSQWKDSIIQTPTGLYGVDTVAKKIWYLTSQGLHILSDEKFIASFLINNITLSEKDKIPVIGIRNVVSHYNAFKQDVIFTFYDHKIGSEETSWSICYNEAIGQFITFYSWIPAFSENIDNIFFTFDRDVSKYIAKLGASLTSNTYADGITLNSVYPVDDWQLSLVNRNLPESNKVNINIQYELLPSPYKTERLFTINGDNLIFNKNNSILIPIQNNTIEWKQYSELLPLLQDLNQPCIYLNIKATVTASAKNSSDQELVERLNEWNKTTANINLGYYTSTVAITDKSIFNILSGASSNDILGSNGESIIPKSDFWKHGFAGIIDTQDTIKPTKWYGHQHPFEFEFVVRDVPNIHKVFTNLEIISNKAEPESFHYEISGDSYDFSIDKPNIYYRQEAFRQFAYNLGFDMYWDQNYTKVTPNYNLTTSLHDTYDNYTSAIVSSNVSKSTIFPCYYYRINTNNHIYDSYINMYWKNRDINKNYNGLTGSEIVYNEDLNQFNIWTHIPNLPIDKFGRMRGNSHYKEDRWKIQIPSINFVQKNEQEWVVPPLPTQYFPTNFKGNINITELDLPKAYRTYAAKALDTTYWTDRKETKIRDKFLRVRIRYSGKDLALITGVITQYIESFA